MRVLTVAVDFDHCLVESSDHGKTIELKPYARYVIQKHSARGVQFILNTSRYGRLLLAALRFIRKERLPIKFRPRLSKIKADVYIDDCNIFTYSIDWIEIDKELELLQEGEK